MNVKNISCLIVVILRRIYEWIVTLWQVVDKSQFPGIQKKNLDTLTDGFVNLNLIPDASITLRETVKL